MVGILLGKLEDRRLGTLRFLSQLVGNKNIIRALRVIESGAVLLFLVFSLFFFPMYVSAADIASIICSLAIFLCTYCTGTFARERIFLCQYAGCIGYRRRRSA